MNHVQCRENFIFFWSFSYKFVLILNPVEKCEVFTDFWQKIPVNEFEIFWHKQGNIFQLEQL